MTRSIRACVSLILVLASVFISAHVALPVQAARSNGCGCKRISISLSRERLRAWDGQRLVLSSPVTTGNAILRTPTGHFVVFAKRSPYTFISPWPKGSSKWYPTSQVSFALEFLGGGYFIHDAPWRGVYGRGSNTSGPPGTSYGGTHGCVNVPYNVARFLYFWAPIGTRVHIVP